MPDTCTLIVVTTLLATPCNTERSCSLTMDQSKQICMSYCKPAPASYNCERPDGSKYIWTPGLGEATTTINIDGAR